MNTILFIVSAGCSVALHAIGFKYECPWCQCVGAIFDSVLAGVIVAALTEFWRQKKEAKKVALARDAYFADLRGELRKTLANVIWFDSCLGDPSFNWKLNPKEYWDMQYAMAIWKTHPAFSLDSAQTVAKLDAIKTGHSPAALQKMSPQQTQKIATMYRIIVAGSDRLIELMRGVERDRIQLAKNEMMPYGQNRDVVQSIKLALELFLNLHGTNYGVAIDQILALLDKLGDVELKQKGIRAWLN